MLFVVMATPVAIYLIDLLAEKVSALEDIFSPCICFLITVASFVYYSLEYVQLYHFLLK